MHATGEYTIADFAEVFGVSRPTVYRTLQRNARQPQWRHHHPIGDMIDQVVL
jgi:DeoR/GlpR family transcriptional regulator of sugar metabolism